MRLGAIDQAKAEDVGKRGRQPVDRHFQCWGARGMCVASKALIPRQTPVSALCSGDDLLISHTDVICGGWCSHCQGNHFGAHHLHPPSSELTTWPITPKNRMTRNRFRHLWGRIRQHENRWWRSLLMESDRPEHSAHPSWLRGCQAFLTLGA